jgi:c-di-GMP-related signal transduction protein
MLEKMNFAQEVKDALLGADNEYSHVLNFILSYERGDWEAVAELSGKLNLELAKVACIYQQSVEWADTIFGMHAVKQ